MDNLQRLPKILPRRSAGCYTVGWFCALPQSELSAARMMLDNRHESAPSENPADENVYYYGDINGHNVVLASLGPGQPGKVSATRLVAPLRQSFPNMKIHLFVGIGGGVPRIPPTDDPEQDIHLGDIVVGWAEQTNVPSIIQYDRVEYIPDGKHQSPGSLNKPSSHLVQALGRLLSNRIMNEGHYDEHLARLDGLSGFRHPGLDKDVLFESTYRHDHEASPTRCDKCDKTRCVKRPARQTTKMVFHQSTILSGDLVMKDPATRDELSLKFYNAACFEMEAAGVMEDAPFLVIRGIADYADSHKNLSWQKYAAATAAAFAREILYELPPSLSPNDAMPTTAPSSDRHSREDTSPNFPQEGRSRRNSMYTSSDPRLPQERESAITERMALPEPENNERTFLDDASISTIEEASANLLTAYHHADQIYANRRKTNHLQQSLVLALQEFNSVKTILLKSGEENIDMHRKIAFRLSQIEVEMTYLPSKLQEKQSHMDKAREFLREATYAARMMNKMDVVDQIRFERCCMEGRGMELKAKRNVNGQKVAAGTEFAMEQIKVAMQMLERSNPSIYQENREYGKAWLKRLRHLLSTAFSTPIVTDR